MRMLLVFCITVIFTLVCIVCELHGIKNPSVYAAVGWFLGVCAGAITFNG